MMARVSLNRTSCARAFSSDMWLTPKNWLSPKRIRSMLVIPCPRCSVGRPVRLLDLLEDPIGLAGAGKRIFVVEIALADCGEEGVELGRILLAAQVEGHRLLQLGDVARVPALLVAVEGAP